MWTMPQANAFGPDRDAARPTPMDQRVRLALSRGLAAAYAETVDAPLPERLRALIAELERRQTRR
jgi:hypothetical protein